MWTGNPGRFAGYREIAVILAILSVYVLGVAVTRDKNWHLLVAQKLMQSEPDPVQIGEVRYDPKLLAKMDRDVAPLKHCLAVMRKAIDTKYMDLETDRCLGLVMGIK